MSKKFRKKNSSLKLIIFLIALLCTTLGYAIFTQELVINGTVSGSANFRVYFAEAWIKHSSLEEDNTDTPNGKDEAEIGSGTVNINTAQGADKVTFDVTLNHPGDKVLIGTKIKNESTMRVKLNDFLVTKSVEIPDINLDYIPLDPTTEKLDPNGECRYEFIVEWDEDSTEQNPGPVTFEIELDYEQDPSPDPTPPSPSHDHGEGELYLLSFDANGGTVSKSSKQITEGLTYGELPLPTRPDYGFVGWFTALENGTQVNASDTVSVTGDITLYAIWNYVGHSMVAIARVEPTCTEIGNIAYYRCTDCNRLYNDEEGTTEITDVEIPALGHSITQIARLEPTCTELGNIAHYKCTRCNKTFSDSEGTTEIDDVEIPALGHNITQVARVEPTCTETGNIAHYKCTRCNKIYSDSGATTEINDSTIPALGHDYHDEDWEVTTAPLCDVAGVETRLCRRNCGAYETREISTLGHDFAEEYTIDIEPTCTETGEKSRHCTRCIARTDITAIPANGHTPGEYTLVTEAMCDTAGEEKTNCTVCGTELTRSITALGHSLTKTAAKAATCTATGNTEYYTCSRCSKKFSDSAGTTEVTNVTIAALGHSLTKTAAKAATCTTAGNIEYYTCSRCSKKFSDSAGTTEVTNVTIAALGHSLTKTAAKAATCTASGNIEYYTCSRCNKKFSDSAGNTEVTNVTIAAKGHSYQKTSTASVCRTCSVCGNQITSHDLKSGTCTYKSCNNCDYSTGTSSHNFTGSWYNGASYNYLSNDKHYQKCSRCGSFGNAKNHSHSKYTYTNTGSSSHIRHSTCTCGKVISSTTQSHSCSTCGAGYGSSNFSHGTHKCSCGITWTK